ncbi:MAG: peptide ABC transporter substrate-binding protein [Planctomycetota bacterium]
MIRNLLFVCGLTLLGILSLFARTSARPRADLVYVNPSGIHTLDPARMSWTQDFRVALNIWEGLTSWNPRTLEPIAGAAEFPPRISDDGLTYTFLIHPDARWSNGDPVTSGDFVRGWRRAIEPGTGTDYTFLITDNIEGTAEYARWRRQGVAVLAALRGLEGRLRLNEDQLRVLSDDDVWNAFPADLRAVVRHPAPDSAPAEWSRFADALLGAPLDWSTIAEAFHARHAAELADRFAQVGLYAEGERTLTVRLAKPCPFFLDLTAFPTLLPCHVSIEVLRERHAKSSLTKEGLVVYDPQWTKPNYRRNSYPGLVTNGPYRLVEWAFKRGARMEANPHHRDAAQLSCRSVEMREFENISASLMSYEVGDVDFLTDLNVPYDHEIARLARSGERPDFLPCPVSATFFLNFNCLRSRGDGTPNPFADARVRRAFSLAIDREGIVERCLARGDRVAYSFVPPGTIPGYWPPDGLRRDVSAAKKLMADAGFPDGAGLPPIELLCVGTDERIVQMLARQWEETLGASIELRVQESKTFAENKANHRFLIARANWYADYNDPTTFLDCLQSANGNNDSGFHHAGYDALLRRAAGERNPAERLRTLREAERLIVEEECPILPIFHYTQLIAVKPRVSGLYPNARLWFPFRYVTVTR